MMLVFFVLAVCAVWIAVLFYKNKAFDTEKAESLLSRGRFDQLIGYCDAYRKSRPCDESSLWYLGVSYFRKENYTEAKNCFSQLVSINPMWRENATAYLDEINLIGLAALKSTRFDVDEAEMLFEKGELDQLIEYCNKQKKVWPNNIYPIWYLGVCCFRKSEYAEAKNYFYQVIRLNPIWRENVGAYLQEIEVELSGSTTKKHYH